MNLQVEEGIGNCLLATIVLACASPAITLNVWPRVDQLIHGGFSSNILGIALLVTLSALGMTAVPFAMKKAPNWGFWWTCLVFGFGLLVLNYIMAIGAVGKSRDDEAGAKGNLIEKARVLKETLQGTIGIRSSLPPFRWTTQEMVDTALLAQRTTDDARRKECEKVGDYCRALVAQLGNRQAELAEIQAAYATTTRARQLDDSIRDQQHALTNLGPIPANSDQQASRIAALVGGFFILGPDASERVATWIIHFVAICAEAFALGAPRIIVTALARKPQDAKETPVQIPPVSVASNPMPAPMPTAKILPRTKPSMGKLEASISDWKQLALIRSPGKLRDWSCYEHYKAHAKEKGLASASFIEFNKKLQELGLKLETDPVAKRDFYLEVAIRQPLKAVS